MAKGCNLIIPLAGKGSRFTKAGIYTPKYKLNAGTKKILEWVLSTISVDEYDQAIFLVNKQHQLDFAVDHYIRSIVPNADICILDTFTQGSLSTVLEAESLIRDKSLPVVIHTSDVWFSDSFSINELDFTSYDGFTITFKSNNSGCSFCKVQDGYVELIKEKQRISNLANVGVYAFSSFELLQKYANCMIKDNELTKNEFYIAPIFNRLIDSGLKVSHKSVDIVHVMGTPDELDFFKSHLRSLNTPVNLGLVSDHSGFKAKQIFRESIRDLPGNIKVVDYGCYSTDPCDYPDMVGDARKDLKSNHIDLVFGFCKSGQGVNICANKHDLIISCLITDLKSLKLALMHNAPNFLAFNAENVSTSTCKEMLSVW